jgi:RNA polymerase sigma-70 factor (ECF subfamily)
VALTLKTLGGLGVPEIARAFLSADATIAQRLVRAKRLIRERGIPYAVPEAAELPERLDSVLDVLYLLFNEGYSAHQGEALVRQDLCAEALRLTTLLAEHPSGDLPRVHALLALMLLHAARLPARTDAGGDLLLLDEQDRALWDRRLVLGGLEELGRASQGDDLSEYHLQAGIAACHAVAPDYAATDWPAILTQYDDLLRLRPTPVIALNRAVALAMVHGPRAGLVEVDHVRTMPGMQDYALLHATAGTFLERSGEPRAAAAHFSRALGCRISEPERRFLERKLQAVLNGAER